MLSEGSSDSAFVLNIFRWLIQSCFIVIERLRVVLRD
jgi:hypothetical protein